MDKVFEQLLQSGEIVAGLGIVWKFVLARPLEKSEEREIALQKRVNELTDVIKEEAEKKRQRLSLPPPRAELPTLDAIKVLGYDPEEEERRRQRPLNTPEPKRLPLDGLGSGRVHPQTDRELRRYVHPDKATTPPDPIPPAYRGKMPSRKG